MKAGFLIYISSSATDVAILFVFMIGFDKGV
jgi:hypothetical protein